MNEHEPWQDLVQAEHQYLNCVGKLYEAGVTVQLRKALAAPEGRVAALRVLRDAPREVVDALAESVFRVAARTHGPVSEARDIMLRVSPEWMVLGLPEVVQDELDDPEADWEIYRRILEVLDLLNQRDLMRVVLKRAAAFIDDEDMVELVNDFKKASEKYLNL